MTLRTISSDRLVDGEKIETIVTDGDGTLFLADDGIYKEVSSSVVTTSGTYTPVFNPGGGVNSAVAIGDFMYIRIGDIVTVSGGISFTTTDTTYKLVEMTLPVTTTFDTNSDCLGTVGGDVVFSSGDGGWIKATSYGLGLGQARAIFQPTSTSGTLIISLMYQVI